MTLLTTWRADDPDAVLVRTTDPAEIATELDRFGIDFERWETRATPAGASADEILAAYQPEIDRLIDDGCYTVVDVAQLHPSDDPAWQDAATAARSKFLQEHTHAEDEVRFFVDGTGIFYLHVADADGVESVLAVLCEAGDLIGVPAATTHWFDMGTRPDFTAIRLFLNDDGWVGSFTGNPISQSFPDFDTLAAAR